MSELNEDVVFDDVLDRLATRFPTVARERIDVVVGEERDRLAGARIRDFIAVLVEHESVKRLRTEAKPASAAAVDEPAN